MNINEYFIKWDTEDFDGVTYYQSRITLYENVINQLKNPIEMIKHAFDRLLVHNITLAYENDQVFWMFKRLDKSVDYELKLKANVVKRDDFKDRELVESILIDIQDDDFTVESFTDGGKYKSMLLARLASRINKEGLTKNSMVYSREARFSGGSVDDTVTIMNEVFIKGVR